MHDSRPHPPGGLAAATLSPKGRGLRRLLAPRSIVFIGGGEAEIALKKTRALGFQGEIFAVNPKRDALGGVKCLASVEELPAAPDAAFIAVRREPTVEAVRALAQMGAGGAIVYASGFAEVGSEGARLQAAMLQAAGGMPLIGPNCYGYVNYLDRAAPWPDEHGGRPRDSGVAIVTQSGNIAVNFTMTRRALPVAGVFALGNQADVDMAAMLEALAEDPRITAIGLHIEGLKDVAAFARAAEAARRARKPVVALKTGRSEQGAKVAMSHTSSLAGSDALYDALFERHGVARVPSVTAFVETLKLLHHGGPLKGARLVSLSCSGGEAALVADMGLGRDVTFPAFDAGTAEKVKATLNEYVAIDNPLDYHTFIWNQEEKLTATFSAALSGGFDCGMLILDVPTTPGMSAATWLVTAKAWGKAAQATGARAALVASLPECLPEDVAEGLSAQGVAPMAGLDDALTAFGAGARIGEAWERAETFAPMLPPARPQGAVRSLSEYEAKQRLKGYGLEVPKAAVCKPEEAVAVAARLGFPVALKASSPALLHKTEAGGVALNLTSEAEVQAATERLGKLAPELLVERMATGAVAELIVGVTRDPQFGLALVVGAGGVLTELLQDTVTLMLPTSRAEIERGLKRLKAWRLVEGFRGKAGDQEAVVKAVAAVARFAAAHAETLEELDVNPLLVMPPGKGAIAVDALIRIRES